ncbi:MAG: hypothetical protein R3E91_01975 [Chlamydiales bacterium]
MCQECALYFELIDPWKRCYFCFKEKGDLPCFNCKDKKELNLKMAASLEYIGSVQTFVKKMASFQKVYLAKIAGAFMFLQFERLGWELPDLVIPVPHSVWFQDHMMLLAQAFAKYVKRKVYPCIGRRMTLLPRRNFHEEEFEAPQRTECYLKKKANIKGKTLLLIDNVMQRGEALSQKADLLRQGMAKKIYVMAFTEMMS